MEAIKTIKHKSWLAIILVIGLVLWFGFEVKVMGHIGAVVLFAVVGYTAARAAWHCYWVGRTHQMAISAVSAIGCWREVLLVANDNGPPLTLGWLILGMMAVGLFWHLGASRRPVSAAQRLEMLIN